MPTLQQTFNKQQHQKVKMNKKLLGIMFLFYVAITVAAAVTQTPAFINGRNFKEFIKHFENLVLNTTDKALIVTTHIYANLTKSLPPALEQAVQPLTTEYLEMVEEFFQQPRTYTEQRKLLRHFRNKNMQIERLRSKLQPDFPNFKFHLISPEFYYTGKNQTEFDNLYLEFMLQFQSLSQTLWDTMTEEVVEQQQDLLEILDEISNEKELNEKDKLYDEFIEMFLFTVEKDVVQNRQLD